MGLGYDKQLFILAFDHRGSFQKKMFGIAGDPSPSETAKIIDAKAVIFDGFQLAISEGAPADEAGLLVDEQYGADTARKAKADGRIFAMPVEKSGIDYFDFEYGEADFGKHILDFDPTFSKILVRYNPEGNAADNERSRTGLKKLGDFLTAQGRKYLFELLVPGEPAQIEKAGGEEAYDSNVRPGLMKQAIKELQDAGIDPDVWKIEGIDRREDCEMISEQARSGGRDGVGCIVLGRGADDEKVYHWLRQGAGVPGYLGFAIGRTLWWDQLKGYLAGSLTRDQAAAQISANYRKAIDVYKGA
jgi:myo-inositol catabolism protein IolC